jgi:hypothetical protein
MAPGTNPGYERAYRIWATGYDEFAEGLTPTQTVRCLHATSRHALCSNVTYARFARPEASLPTSAARSMLAAAANP